MSQTKFFRKELVNELKTVERMMRKEPNVEKKLYYFTAAYGITSRTYRYSFSKDVLLADFVLQACHQTLNERIQRLKAGDQTMDFDENIFNKLGDSLKLLISRLESEESIQEPLEDMLAIAFSVSGPGNYLKEKGMIKI